MWTSDEFLPGFLQLVAWLAGLGVIVGLAIWWARRRDSNALALTVTRMGAGFILGLIGVGIIGGGINHFTGSQLWLDDGMGQWVRGNQSSIQSPTCDAEGSWTQELYTGSSAAPTTYCAGVIEHVPFLPRLVIFAGMLLTLLAAAAIVQSIYTAALRAGMRTPFDPTVSRSFRFAAIVLLAGTLIGDVFTTIGMTLAARSLEWEPGVVAPFVFQPPVWPFAVALGLFALSAIFRYGAVLQRETEGLV